jgi:hypothetical protein
VAKIGDPFCDAPEFAQGMLMTEADVAAWLAEIEAELCEKI